MTNKVFISKVIACHGGLELFCFGPAGYYVAAGDPAYLECDPYIFKHISSIAEWKKYLIHYQRYLKDIHNLLLR